MKTKHTPGPWVARKVRGLGYPGQSGYAIDFNEDQEQVVDYVYEEADARLIASAPELLEALEDLKREVILSDVPSHYIDSHFKPWIDKARAAIKKATGEEA